MKREDFVLAATTNDLSREEDVRDIADLVEFQMAGAEDPLDQLTEYNGELPLIVTNRDTWDDKKISDNDRIDELNAAARLEHVEMVDIELRIAQEHEWVIEELRENDVEIIVSYYNFEHTPDKEELIEIVNECSQYGDIAKVAVYAEEMADSLTLLEVIDTSEKMGIKVAGISMGESARHTRAIAPFYGSRIVYAPVDLENSGYAPGQIDVHELASLIETISKGGDHVELMDVLKGKFPNT